MRCANCSCVFAHLSREQTRQANFAYGAEAEACYAEGQTLLDTLWFEWIADRFTRRMGPGRVLDVGCGNGALLRCMKRRGWQAEGADVSPWAEAPAARSGYRLHRGEIESLGLEGAFDLVTSTSTLEHIWAPRPHVQALLRAARPGGCVHVAGVPNYGALSVRLGLANFYLNEPPGHVNYFTPRSLGRLLDRVGEQGCTARLSIRTYGIPEAHRAYAAVRPLWRRESSVDPVAPPPRSDREAALRRLLAETLVRAFYELGRPFEWGDKLEAVLHRER